MQLLAVPAAAEIFRLQLSHCKIRPSRKVLLVATQHTPRNCTEDALVLRGSAGVRVFAWPWRRARGKVVRRRVAAMRTMAKVFGPPLIVDEVAQLRRPMQVRDHPAVQRHESKRQGLARGARTREVRTRANSTAPGK